MRKLLQNSMFLLFLFTFSFISAQESEYGMASYYGDEYNGSETASGQRYDKNELTAAHKTLPMGTKVRVTRLDNKKFVDVRINDRGPYLKGRIIDLSGKAADILGMRKDGTSEVQLDVLGKGGKVTTSVPKKKNTVIPTPKAATNRGNAVKQTTPKPKTKPATKTPEVYTSKGSTTAVKKTESKKTYTPKAKTVAAKEENTLGADFELVTRKNFSQYGLYKIELARPKEAGYGVQVASLTSYENVLKQVATLQGKWFKNILMSIERGSNNEPVYKIILGPFPDQDTAESYKRHATKKGVKGFVVSLENIEY